jgi:hypothetical protein
MPYTIRKVPNKNCYRVTNKQTKKVLAKCTTMEKAKKQLRLLNAIDNNPNFVLKLRRKNQTKSNKTKRIRKK